ncbi:MAG: acyl carrier protein [Calditrichaceae bacterium]|nr:acyl carrier protein [Calditrichaceae bacterium]
MTDQDIIGRIKEILIEEFEVDEAIIKPDSNMYEELELDSLDSVDLVVALENEFGFKIDRTRDEEALRHMRTLNDAVAFIKQKIA